MDRYCVGFIAVASQKMALYAGNKDIDEYFKNVDPDKLDAMDFIVYCRSVLGYQANGIYRFLRYMKSSPLSNSALQALASIYAGHFAIFAEASGDGGIQRTVTGFNPASLTSSMIKTTPLKQGGAMPGKWYDDKEMFMDPTRRVISIPVSKAVYETFRDDLEELKKNRSTSLTGANSSGNMLYGWYMLDKSASKYNCVTASITASSKIIEKLERQDPKPEGLDELKNVTDKLDYCANTLTRGGAGTLTWVLLGMQAGSFLVEDRKLLDGILYEALNRRSKVWSPKL
ncbi:hypothetical protein ACW7BJ_23285 [Azospirillum argentinense]